MPQLRFGKNEWNLVYRVALRVLKAPDQAEDAAQDALIRAYRKRSSFAGASRPESWLYRIAYNTALSHLRSPHIRRRASAANENDEAMSRLDRTPTADGEQPDALTSAARLADNLEGCLSQLGDADRRAFTERFLLGTSERELGDILGVSTNAAKQRAFRARRKIRSCIESKRETGCCCQ
jgi:RNA polymerase sigma-70 factor (ECF subfamily)